MHKIELPILKGLTIPSGLYSYLYLCYHWCFLRLNTKTIAENMKQELKEVYSALCKWQDLTSPAADLDVLDFTNSSNPLKRPSYKVSFC